MLPNIRSFTTINKCNRLQHNGCVCCRIYELTAYGFLWRCDPGIHAESTRNLNDKIGHGERAIRQFKSEIWNKDVKRKNSKQFDLG